MKYRLDIDGLRALAVLLVVFFHYEISGFSGGYIGVDVFFTLSGYLIGGIVFSQLEKNRFSFSEFYMRRVRRLFPAYFVVMLVAAIGAYYLLLPSDLKDFGQSLASSTLYVSNMLFYIEAGYFDTASHTKPLLHTWSLSVEEQFYLFFPAIAWICYKFGKKIVIGSFFTLTVLSFIGAVLMMKHDTSAAFFLYPFRAWELFIGVILAMRIAPQSESPSTINTLSVLGLLMILFSAIFYEQSTDFPGASALVPCFGTVLLLYAGQLATRDCYVQKFLSLKPFVFLGKISYSLYLWHWPLLAFYSYSFHELPNGWTKVFILLITVGLSILSWRYVEQPIREVNLPLVKKKSAVFVATSALSVVCILFGYNLHRTNGMPDRLDDNVATFASVANDFIGWDGNCHDKNNSILNGIRHCTAGDPYVSDNIMVVWGDSHAAALQRGLVSAIEEQGVNAVILWEAGCPPVFGVLKEENSYGFSDTENCRKHIESVKEYLSNNKHRISSFMWIARWSYYFSGEGYGIDRKNTIQVWPEDGSYDREPQSIVLRNAMLDTAKFLKELSVPIYLLEQFPEYKNYHSKRAAISLLNNQRELLEIESNESIEDYRDVELRQRFVQDSFESLLDHDDFRILKTHTIFCDTKNCSAFYRGVPAYADNNHLSTEASKKVSFVFQPAIDAAKHHRAVSQE
ncbi:acyltransferase [bacterium SCSIO 12696]|uniref:acyltransferase family protein n=1 Tax=Porticoccus sp. W117 TaxID=3054777 RepID=UPI002204EE35|nr:acyltransferase family protein [Porticoccus sp. W117]MDM3870619.1 acyltransferase family protein [Porticoccus sp. W117]UTW44880.1 acyltransferase [bacterium SCSIO 12696]